jgi:isopenicillin N synthase-like dioxygenase
MMEIPVIDFAPFICGDADSRQVVARQIYQACHEIGFMYVKNLVISTRLIHQIFAESKQFFFLPFEIKNQLAWSDEFSNQGYVGLERERLNPYQAGDLKEAFNIGKEFNSAQNSSALFLHHGLLKYDKFKETVLAFYEACSEVANHLCQALAIALQLPESFFLERHNQQHHTLRLLHYPPLVQPPKPGQSRAGEHSDYGSFTLLFQDEIGGLEVCTAQEEWIAAPYIPDTIIVNTGDLMQRWTNHVFCSTKHRVRIPTDCDASQRCKSSRYSIAFFCHPNNEVEIACLETCKTPNSPSLYPLITAGDYLLSRLQATY